MGTEIPGGVGEEGDNRNPRRGGGRGRQLISQEGWEKRETTEIPGGVEKEGDN